MIEVYDSDRERADAEALDWIIALQEAPDDEALHGRFRRWRAAAATNAAAWDESARVYAAIGETTPVHARRWRGQNECRRSSPSVAMCAARRNRAARGARPVRKRVTAALAAAAVVLALVTVPKATLRWQADVITGAGELHAMTLADGSHVSLRPGSAIRIDYSANERRIKLLHGQAWFDVQHDARPFRVAARNVETTDIGTAFEVGMSDSAVTVAVGHGVVRVDDARTGGVISERLVAGQKASIDAAGKVRRENAPPELIGVWRDGRLAVQDQPVREVVEALRPWHRGVILVQPGALAQRRVTGLYDLHDAAGAMTALTKAHGGRVTRITPWLLILSDD
ncbi:FecR family protein [Brevundimonas diminuta]|uniref:FecR family protein n=1 Tax=Brevundimonas diminuta TaxID=293 RepID=UPI003D02B5EF